MHAFAMPASKFSTMMLAFLECTGYGSVLHANLNTYDSCSQGSMCTSCVDNCMTSAVNSLNSHRAAPRSWMISATQASLTCIQDNDTHTGQSQDLVADDQCSKSHDVIMHSRCCNSVMCVTLLPGSFPLWRHKNEVWRACYPFACDVTAHQCHSYCQAH